MICLLLLNYYNFAGHVRELLRRIGPPIGFPKNADRARQLRHLRRMELRMTGTSRQVHYVDFFISCATLRYRQQRKPIGDLDLAQIKGKLALELQIVFPSIMDARLEDTGEYLVPLARCGRDIYPGESPSGQT